MTKSVKPLPSFRFATHNFLFVHENKYEDAAKLKELISDYLSIDNQIPSVAGLCTFLEIGKEEFKRLASDDRTCCLIESFLLILEADRNEGLLSGRYTASGTMFDLKVNFKWKEPSELEDKPGESILKTSIESRIKELNDEIERKKNND